MEYSPRTRNLDDLWLSAFPIGTEWESIDEIKEFNWNFKNLEKTLEEGGQLYGKTVYLFGTTEPQLLDVNGEWKTVSVPVVVAVDSPFPPTDKIGIDLVQTGEDKIIPMEHMNMSWVPYVPLEDGIESLKTKIFTLCCTQGSSALRLMETEGAYKSYYCMPYYMQLKPPKDGTVFRFVYPLDPPIIIDFDWEVDDYKVFADKIVKDEGLLEDEREKIAEFLKEKVKRRKIGLEKAEERRKKAIEDMDPKQREAFGNIKFYKFYPLKTPDTPEVGKVRYINRYYRMAHYLM